MRACRSFNLSCNILSETARLSRSLEAFARRSGGQPLTHHQWILPRSLHLSPRAGFAGFSESSVFVQILLESQVRVFAWSAWLLLALKGLNLMSCPGLDVHSHLCSFGRAIWLDLKISKAQCKSPNLQQPKTMNLDKSVYWVYCRFFQPLLRVGRPGAFAWSCF